MSTKKTLKSKLQGMAKSSEDSRESETGFLDVGNSANTHFKARAVRNNDNGSHH